MKQSVVEGSYAQALLKYTELGVDVEQALSRLDKVPLSLHCWQGDDVGGFEAPEAELSGGGIAVTGNYPGRARNIGELRKDLEAVCGLVPGAKRINLHAMYGDFEGQMVERDAIGAEHFQSWVDWAAEMDLGLDFNATLFSHPRAADGFTLSHRDREVREFWIAHVQRCREIGAFMGQKLGTPCVHNLWIPDGSKDLTVNRYRHRQWLLESLERIYRVDDHPRENLLDAVESKLFGLGSEAYVVGSHEFYLGFAQKFGKMVCLDMGHFHPTEQVSDKISALLPFFEEILLHVSRPLRWDSDHVVIFNDELRSLLEEVVRADALDRVHLALDFFDASINRIGAWALGARAGRKALLAALLEPITRLREYEEAGDGFARLALLEEIKTLPVGAVWDRYCAMTDVPSDGELIAAVRDYEKTVLSGRE